MTARCLPLRMRCRRQGAILPGDGAEFVAPVLYKFAALVRKFRAMRIMAPFHTFVMAGAGFQLRKRGGDPCPGHRP
jgi:hypothetical protein